MARADPKPGRRRAVPEPKPRRLRRPRERDVEPPRPAQPPKPSPTARPGLVRRWSGRALRAAWLLVTLAGVAAVLVAWTPFTVREWFPLAGAVVVTTMFSLALAVRTGGRPMVVGVLAAALSAGAVLSAMPVLLASAAVSTAVVGAVLGVMVTTPAARVAGVVRECLVAVLVAGVAAFAANAYDAQVSVGRAGYLVLGLSLLGALALAYRLAAGLHGLGRRGAIMLVSGVGLMVLILAYTEALSRWGSPELVSTFERTSRDVRDLIGAVPHPAEFLLGVPALAWGVSTRARRRQGWWGTGFGAAGTAAVTVTLLDPRLPLSEAGLGTLYSLVAGLLLGYLVIRADSFLSGARGRRARRLEEASAHRPEPGRSYPLL